MANYNLTQTGDEVQRILNSVQTLTDLGIGLEDNGAYDVTAHNSGATFADLSSLLSSQNLSTLIPTEVRKGGMSVKYVQSSDNKYIQARCMAQNFTTDVTQWQGVDTEPIDGSNNLVESGGVAQKLKLTNSNFGCLINYSNNPSFKGWVNGETFSFDGGAEHKVVPINGGQVLKIKAGANSTMIAIVKSYTPPTTENNIIDYATGESARAISAANPTPITITVPLDAKFVVIGEKFNINYINTPSILEIDGHNLFESVLNDIRFAKNTSDSALSQCNNININLKRNNFFVNTIGLLEQNPTNFGASLYMGWKCNNNGVLKSLRLNINVTSELLYIIKLDAELAVTSTRSFELNNLEIGVERQYDISQLDIYVEENDYIVIRNLNFKTPSSDNAGDIQFTSAPELNVVGTVPTPRSFCFEADIEVSIGSTLDVFVNKSKTELFKKTYLVIGDSISDPRLTIQATKRYFDWLQDVDKMIIINDGHSGTGFVRADGGYQNIPTRIENYTFNAPDYISIFAGTNDWFGTNGAGACELGEFGDTPSSGTFFGALEDAFTKLVNKYPSSKILIALPIHRYTETSPNEYGNTLLEYVNAIRQVAFKYSFAVIDLYNEGAINPLIPALQEEYFRNSDTLDGTHPNNKGHERLYHKFKQGLLRT